MRSERISCKLKLVNLLNPERYFAVDQSLRSALCVHIDELLVGQASLVEIDLPKSDAVDVNSHELVRPRSVGVEHMFVDDAPYGL